MKPTKSLLSKVGGIGLAIFVTGTLSSCVSPYPGPNERTGGVVGAASGALAGAAIGHQSGRGLEGAALGGVLGAIAGSLVGSAADDQVRYEKGNYDEDGYYYDDEGRYVYPRRPYYSSVYIAPAPLFYFGPRYHYHRGHRHHKHRHR